MENEPTVLATKMPAESSLSNGPTKVPQDSPPSPPKEGTTVKMAISGNGPYFLAQHSNKGVRFSATLEHIQVMEYAKEDGYLLHFKLDFMNPFSSRRRIRGAVFTVHIVPVEQGQRPQFLFVKPEMQLTKMSEREISFGAQKSVTLSANGASFGGASLGAVNTIGEVTKFKGVRSVQGTILNESTACWKISEDQGSKSGVVQSIKLIAGVRSRDQFHVKIVQFDVNVQDRLRFWKHNTLQAKLGESVPVNSIDKILESVLQEKEQKVELLLKKAEFMIETTRHSFTTLREAIDASFRRIIPLDLLKSGEAIDDDLQMIQAISKACQEWQDPISALNNDDYPNFFSLIARIFEQRRLDLKLEERENDEEDWRKRKRLDLDMHDDLSAAKEEIEKARKRIRLEEMKKQLSRLNAGLAHRESGSKKGRKKQVEAPEEQDPQSLKEAREAMADLRDRIQELSFEHTRDDDMRSSREEEVILRSDSALRDRSLERHNRLYLERPRQSQWIPPEPGTFLGIKGEVNQEELNNFSAYVPAYTFTVSGTLPDESRIRRHRGRSSDSFADD